jgi:hypothetical protein
MTPAPVTLGLKPSFGALQRVSYVPVTLGGSRRVGNPEGGGCSQAHLDAGLHCRGAADVGLAG